MRFLRQGRFPLLALSGLLGCLLLSCTHRRPLPGSGDGGPGSLLLVPDGSRPDGTVPRICLEPPLPLTRHLDPRGNFTLAVVPEATVQTITITAAKPRESAVVIARGPVVALAATSEAATREPLEHLALLRQRFAAALQQQNLGTLAVRASGILGKSAEGLPAVKEALWEVSSSVDADAVSLRNLLLAAILDRPPSELSGLPGPTGPAAAGKLVVKLTMTLRSEGLTVSAAVASQEELDDLAAGAPLWLDDLGNGTALARAQAETLFECETQAVQGGPVADIIWVIDESGSMNDNRQDIVNHASTFLKKALQSGLDLRLGVTGVKKPDTKILMGKLCSRSSPNEGDDGGEDRFLLPEEEDLFTACVKNPPYFEGGAEYGLTNAYWAVKRHLPRLPAAPDRIRSGAKLAIIFVSDEAPMEVKVDGSFLGKTGFLSAAEVKPHACSLGASHQTLLAELIQPVSDLFSGAPDPDSQALVYAIGGSCHNTCNAEIGYGYQELAAARGGLVADVCQQDLGASLQVIIDSIIAAASPVVLHHEPISSTLRVEVNGLELPRSASQGFSYDAASNSLSFINVQVARGNEVTVAYQRFSTSL